MQAVVVSFILIAAHVSVRSDCRAVLQHPQQQQQQRARRGSSGTGTLPDLLTRRKSFDWELHGSVKRGVRRSLSAVVSVRAALSDSVSILDLREKHFLCSTSKGKQHKSRRKDREDCLFWGFLVNLANHRDGFRSTRGTQLLKQRRGGGGGGGGGSRRPDREPPGAAPVPPWKVKRHRRSGEVNPHDPLQSEMNPPADGDKAQPEQDEAGAVSKETIRSCDDPLNVLRPGGSGSPVKANFGHWAEPK